MIFLEPLNLLFLFLPILFFYNSLKTTPTNINSIFSRHVLRKISLYPDLTNKSNYKLLLVAISLFIIALAQPVINSNKYSNEPRFTPLVIALDISNSMASNDIYPNRFLFAKKKIKSMLQQHPHLRVSLLLFARDAYLAYPMSEDFDSLTYVISNLKETFKSGSNLFAALEGAKHILREYSSKNILLLSDGGSSDDLREEAKYIHDNNLTLNTLYISKNPSQKDKIKELSLLSGGAFEEFSFGNNDIEFLLNAIQKHSQLRKENQNITNAAEQIQLFYYLVFLATFLVFFIFLNKYEFKSKISIFFTLFCLNFALSHVELNANILDFKKIYDAKEFYKKQDYDKAINIYIKLPKTKETTYNLANAYYKKQEYKKAIKMYKKSLFKNDDKENAKIYYNIANALFYLRKLHSSKQYYVKSLKIKNDIMVQDNLKILLKTIQHKKSNTNDKYKLHKTMSSFSKEIANKADSNYRVKLTKMVLNEEDKWMKYIENEKSILFLQKLNTKRMSKNANKND